MEKVQNWLWSLGRALRPFGVKALVVILVVVFGSYAGSLKVGTAEDEFLNLAATADGCAAASPDDKAVCLAYHGGEFAESAFKHYRDAALEVYRLYGGTAPLQVFDDLHCSIKVIPVVQYFVENDQILQEASNRLANGVAELWNAATAHRQPQFSGEQFQKLKPDQRGWLALQAAAENCDQFLSQFVVKGEGSAVTVTRDVGSTAISALSRLLAGGVLDYTRLTAAGEPITTEVATEAGADALLLLGGPVLKVFKAMKIARARKVGEVGRARAIGEAVTLPATLKLGVKAGFVATGVTLAYLAVEHPIAAARYLFALVGEVVAIFGWWVLVAISLGVWLLIAPIFRFIRFVLRPFVWSWRGLKRWRERRFPPTS